MNGIGALCRVIQVEKEAETETNRTKARSEQFVQMQIPKTFYQHFWLWYATNMHSVGINQTKT